MILRVTLRNIFLEIVITRDDIPDNPEETLVYPDPWHPKLSTDHSYIYSFPEGIPIRLNFRIDGLDSGNSIIVGFCIPLNATGYLISNCRK